MNRKKNYDLIDLLKMIAAVLVVMIHTDAFYDINSVLYSFVYGGISRLAIPFFFTTTAFFFFQKQREDGTYCRRFVNRMAKLYMIWFVLLLPVTVFNRFIVSKDSFFLTLLKFIRGTVFSASFSGSWYLTSCVFCAVLFSFIEKITDSSIKERVIVLLSAAFYAIPVFTSSYGTLVDILGVRGGVSALETIFCTPYLNVFVGIPFFAIGRYLVKEMDSKRAQDSDKLALVISALLFGIEIIIVNRFKLAHQINSFLMSGPLIYYLLKCVLSNCVHIPFAKGLRMCSTITYFSQFLWIFVVEFVEWALKVSFMQTQKFLLVLLLCVSTHLAVYVLQRFKAFKWMRYMY